MTDNVKADMVITLCDRCMQRMSMTYNLVYVPGTTNLQSCQGAYGVPHEGPTNQYEATRWATIAMRRALEARKENRDLSKGKERERAPW